MSSYLLHLLLLLLIILSPSPPSASASAYTLPQLECFSSDTPATCLGCVNSDPAAPKADPPGIAAIVVGCLARHAAALSANFTSLASREKDKKLKDSYVQCSKGYFLGHRILNGSAIKALKDGKYDGAEQFVVKAWGYDNDCYQDLFGAKYNYDKVGGAGGDIVTKGMKMYEELNEAACRIIERLT